MKPLYVILALLIIGCRSENSTLPILSYKIDDTGNKSYYSIVHENFVDQSGQAFDNSALDGRVYIANFFFTRCPSICPPMQSALINLADDMDGFLFVSHTIDPEYDTSEVLNAYAESTGISKDRWIFLRSSEVNTKAIATQFMTNFKPNEDGTDFYHSSYIALVDRKGQIRGFYNSLVTEEIERLREDVLQLNHQ